MISARTTRALAGVLLLLSVTAGRAQYTADYQTNIISGVTSNWTGDYTVGNSTFADVLLIQNSGALVLSNSGGRGMIGYTSASTNNKVVVTGSNSVWVVYG